MERTPTRYLLTPSSVFEVPLDNGRVGFCHIIRKDEGFAELCALYRGTFEPGTAMNRVVHEDADVLGLAYVNSASARMRGWRKIGNAALPLSVQLPEAVFFGDESRYWKVTYEADGREEVIQGTTHSRDELLSRGWISKTLWISEAFERAFMDDRMPRWQPRD